MVILFHYFMNKNTNFISIYIPIELKVKSVQTTKQHSYCYTNFLQIISHYRTNQWKIDGEIS